MEDNYSMKEDRKRLGYRQEDIAQMLGVSQPMICKIEHDPDYDPYLARRYRRKLRERKWERWFEYGRELAGELNSLLDDGNGPTGPVAA